RVAEVVDGGDAGVVELRGRARLAREALAGAFVLAQLGEHDLDRDVAAQDGVVGLVDLAHGASADLLDDAVLADLAKLHARPRHRITRPRGPSARGRVPGERSLGYTRRWGVPHSSDSSSAGGIPCLRPTAASRPRSTTSTRTWPASRTSWSRCPGSPAC